MKSLTVLGAGQAGFLLISKIREQNKQIEITLIDKNIYYFDRKELISDLNFKNWIKLSDWASKNKIEFVNDTVERINPNQRKIYLKNSEPVKFETLVIASGLQSRKLEIKGDHREGFFYFSDLDIFKLRDLLKISSEAVVYVSTLLGIKLAFSLRKISKDVTVVCRDRFNFLGQNNSRIIELMQGQGINVYLNCFLEEAIGESTIRAVKLNPLKVISSQMVFVDSGFTANRDFFEPPLCLRDNFFTENENIYFAGDVSSGWQEELFFQNNNEETKLSANILADFLLGAELSQFVRKQQDDHAVVEELIGRWESKPAPMVEQFEEIIKDKIG